MFSFKFSKFLCIFLSSAEQLKNVTFKADHSAGKLAISVQLMFNSRWVLYLKVLAWELYATSGKQSDVTTDGCTGEKVEEEQKKDESYKNVSLFKTAHF